VEVLMVEEKKEFNTESIGDTEITEKRKKKDKSNAETQSAQRRLRVQEKQEGWVVRFAANEVQAGLSGY
jgi:hypothetical protein